MSQRLPSISGHEVIKALESIGYAVVPGRGKGSHTVVHNAAHQRIITVPAHDPVKRGTLRAVIRQAGLSIDEFRELLDS